MKGIAAGLEDGGHLEVSLSLRAGLHCGKLCDHGRIVPSLSHTSSPLKTFCLQCPNPLTPR